jgi:hypothetical protein
MAQAPEGRQNSPANAQISFAPAGACSICSLAPRLTPWAIFYCPSGAKPIPAMYKVKHNNFVTIAGLVLFLCVTGCVSLSTDPRLVGTYAADNSETLIFMSDTRVFHTQIVNGKEERHFLGYYVNDRSNPHHLGFCAPDTSSFLGTSFMASDDFSIVTASWDNLRKPKDSWQVTYRKTAQKN